jgi:hypothetical protein
MTIADFSHIEAASTTAPGSGQATDGGARDVLPPVRGRGAVLGNTFITGDGHEDRRYTKRAQREGSWCQKCTAPRHTRRWRQYKALYFSPTAISNPMVEAHRMPKIQDHSSLPDLCVCSPIQLLSSSVRRTSSANDRLPVYRHRRCNAKRSHEPGQFPERYGTPDTQFNPQPARVPPSHIALTTPRCKKANRKERKE